MHSLFNLMLEDGEHKDVPEFYLYTLTDLNGRTTFSIEGICLRYDTIRYDTIDDLHCKTDRQAASLIYST